MRVYILSLGKILYCNYIVLLWGSLRPLCSNLCTRPTDTIDVHRNKSYSSSIGAYFIWWTPCILQNQERVTSSTACGYQLVATCLMPVNICEFRSWDNRLVSPRAWGTQAGSLSTTIQLQFACDVMSAKRFRDASWRTAFWEVYTVPLQDNKRAVGKNERSSCQ